MIYSETGSSSEFSEFRIRALGSEYGSKLDPDPQHGSQQGARAAPSEQLRIRRSEKILRDFALIFFYYKILSTIQIFIINQH